MSFRPKQFSKKKPCYFCGHTNKNSREHAPIKVMFEAFNCDSITVPSCDQHNTEKSTDDLAILAFLIRGIYPSIRSGSLAQNPLDAIHYAHRKINNSSSVKGKQLIQGRNDSLGSEFSYISDGEIIKSWIQQLTAAIVWSAIGYYDNSVDWNSFDVWSENYHPGDNPFDLFSAAEKSRELLITRGLINRKAGKWWRGWSAYPKPYPPDIYRFYVAHVGSEMLHSEENKNEMIIQHRFYGQFSWYVYIKASESMASDVQLVLEQCQED